jgi:hypothetical protein
MSSLRGKIAVRTTVARGAFSRQRSMIAFRPRVISAILSADAPAGAGAPPTLLVPASSTMTFGSTPSSSPFSIRQRTCCVLSPPQPKLAAFQPKKLAVQCARKSG